MRRLTVCLLFLVMVSLANGQDSPKSPPPDPQGGARGPRVGGAITAISGDTITVKAFDDRVLTIHVSDGTRYRKDGNDAKLSDFKVGDMIMVRGQAAGEKDWNATVVMSRSGGGMGNPQQFREQLGKRFIAGEVKAIDGLKLTIARPDGETQTIAVDESTSFRKQGESVTLADIHPGDRIYGRGEVKDGIFVPSELNVGEPPAGRGPARVPPDQR